MASRGTTVHVCSAARNKEVRELLRGDFLRAGWRHRNCGCHVVVTSVLGAATDPTVSQPTVEDGLFPPTPRVATGRPLESAQTGGRFCCVGLPQGSARGWRESAGPIGVALVRAPTHRPIRGRAKIPGISLCIQSLFTSSSARSLRPSRHRLARLPTNSQPKWEATCFQAPRQSVTDTQREQPKASRQDARSASDKAARGNGAGRPVKPSRLVARGGRPPYTGRFVRGKNSINYNDSFRALLRARLSRAGGRGRLGAPPVRSDPNESAPRGEVAQCWPLRCAPHREQKLLRQTTEFSAGKKAPFHGKPGAAPKPILGLVVRAATSARGATEALTVSGRRVLACAKMDNIAVDNC